MTVVPGLDGPVRILIDRWGIPHIRATTIADLFFGQGFNAARDRLWQIDLWRKRGLGLLAADFGPGYLAQDFAARLFLYRGDMDAEWAAYGSDAKAIAETFVRGINAYVDLITREPERLPPEFRLLGTRPSKWAPEDVVRIRTHGWMRNALSEVSRARVLARGDASADLLRMNLEPDVSPHIAPGLDLRSITPEMLDLYRLATAPVTFTDARLQAPLDAAWQWTSVSPAGDVERQARPQESNNWAVGGSRTATGRPILANDPHRLLSVPSLRYLVHLTAPGLDLIGAGEPSFPGIAIGHNGGAAFGLTLFLGPDQEDVYVYETHPDNSRAYRYGDGWEDMRLVREGVDVRGAGHIDVTLKFTRHGAVIYEDPSSHRALAIRSVWSTPGTAPYGASLLAMRSRTVGDFRAALKLWGTPPVNYVYADRDGDIAWITAGLSPVRRTWDGLLPVPGDGRYEWDGFLDAGVLPSLENPPAGFVASANAMNLPAGWSRDRHPIGYEWDDRSRADRIVEVLAADTEHSVEAASALQTDVVSLPARRILKLAAGLHAEDRDTQRALELFRGWDRRIGSHSGAAALFEVWWTRFLKPAVLERLVQDETTRRLLLPGDIERVLQLLETSGVPGGDVLLRSTLSDAVRACATLFGADMSGWSWGRLHRAGFEHAVSRLDGASGLDVEPVPVGGSESTLMKAAYRPGDFRVVMGASVRLVIDVGDWDKSIWINTPGQSGDPRSPHYSDLHGIWAGGEYVPMLYSAEAVESAIEEQMVLTPADRMLR